MSANAMPSSLNMTWHLAKRETIVMVRWALIISAAYLMLFSDTSAEAKSLGMLVVAIFLASNLLVARLPREKIATQQFNAGVIVLDTILIGLSLYLADQLTVQFLVLCLGVVLLALSGLSLGVVAAVTVWITSAYLFLNWLLGNEALWSSGMLMQVPFLLCAAVVYAWVMESAGRNRSGTGSDALDGGEVGATLDAELTAMKRCEAAMAEGSVELARAAMREVVAEHHKVRASLAGVLPS